MGSCFAPQFLQGARDLQSLHVLLYSEINIGNKKVKRLLRLFLYNIERKNIDLNMLGQILLVRAGGSQLRGKPTYITLQMLLQGGIGNLRLSITSKVNRGGFS